MPKDFPKERYCTCVYLCNLIIRYGHPKQPNALRVNVKYITTFHQCIYYGSNKHFGYNYFIYAIYVLILYIYRSNKHFGYEYIMYSMYVPILYIL